MTTEKLSELFQNKSDCYADTMIHVMGNEYKEGSVVQAMTEKIFVELCQSQALKDIVIGEQWISVEERLPDDENVLCFELPKHIFNGFYTVGDKVEYDDYGTYGLSESLTEKELEDEVRYLPKGWYEECESRGECDTEFFKRKVTHWQPLPQPPAVTK